MGWTELVTNDYAVGKVLSDDLWQELADNDIAACEHVFQLPFAAASVTVLTYQTFVTYTLRVPSSATTLRLVSNCVHTGAGTGYFKWTLDGSTDSNEVTVTSGTSGQKTHTFTVTSKRGTWITIEGKAKVSGVSNTLAIDQTALVLNRWTLE